MVQCLHNIQVMNRKISSETVAHLYSKDMNQYIVVQNGMFATSWEPKADRIWFMCFFMSARSTCHSEVSGCKSVCSEFHFKATKVNLILRFSKTVFIWLSVSTCYIKVGWSGEFLRVNIMWPYVIDDWRLCFHSCSIVCLWKTNVTYIWENVRKPVISRHFHSAENYTQNIHIYREMYMYIKLKMVIQSKLIKIQSNLYF